MSKLIMHKRSWLHVFKKNRYDYYEYDDGSTLTVYDDGYRVKTTHNGCYITRILPDGRQHTNYCLNEYWPPIDCWERKK